MPNHITNYLVIFGTTPKTREILDTINGNELIDFNKIIPMPKELRTVSSPARIISESQYEKEMSEYKLKLKNPTELDKLTGVTHGITEKMSNEYRQKFGADNWYDWSIVNWGTKWNSYDNEYHESLPTNNDIFETRISFQTAWSPPIPVILKLSQMFPENVFILKWYDEDIGHNTGRITFLNGDTAETYFPEGGSVEAYELIAEIDPNMKEYMEEILTDLNKEEP
jgi:hypothetical protein